jgi:hypothetical protein
MGRLLRAWGLRLEEDGPLGAQTGRRGGAGPVGGLLGGKDPTGRFSSESSVSNSREYVRHFRELPFRLPWRKKLPSEIVPTGRNFQFP